MFRIYSVRYCAYISTFTVKYHLILPSCNYPAILNIIFGGYKSNNSTYCAFCAGVYLLYISRIIIIEPVVFCHRIGYSAQNITICRYAISCKGKMTAICFHKASLGIFLIRESALRSHNIYVIYF